MRFADKNDVLKIRRLWDIAFGEEKEFNDYFFKNVFKAEYTLIMEEKGEIISMAQMLPYNIKGIGQVSYIYGAVTSPYYRGQGCMAKLLEYSFELDKKMGRAASVLIPAEKSLFDYYKKIGYEPKFYIDRKIYNCTGRDCNIIKAAEKDIPKLMEIYTGDVERTAEYWLSQLDMLNTLGGCIYIYNNSYGVVSDNIDEFFGNDTVLIDAICKRLNKKSISVTYKGNNIPFGMIRKHSDFSCKNMYMNMMYN